MTWQWVVVILGIFLLLMVRLSFTAWTNMKLKINESIPRTFPDMMISSIKKEEKMAEPKLEIDRRLDRMEKAIGTMARLVFEPEAVEEIEKILRGEESEEEEDLGNPRRVGE
jgi:hypothetical protein